MHSPHRLQSHLSRPLELEFLAAVVLLSLALLWQAWRPFGLWQTLGWRAWVLPLGVVAALPPLLLILLLESARSRRWRWVRIFHDNLASVLAPLLGHLRWHEMLALSCLAGLSEEVFFRGVLQQAIGLVPSALIFGLLHTLSLPYLVWATLTGLYLGALMQATGNLWVPILTHTLIDLVGLGYLRGVVAPRGAG